MGATHREPIVFYFVSKTRFARGILPGELGWVANGETDMNIGGRLLASFRRAYDFSGELDVWECQKYQATIEGLERAERIRGSAIVLGDTLEISAGPEADSMITREAA